MVQPPAAAPPGIDPMILQQQQAAAQEAALQQVSTLSLVPNRIYLFRFNLRVQICILFRCQIPN